MHLWQAILAAAGIIGALIIAAGVITQIDQAVRRSDENGIHL